MNFTKNHGRESVEIKNETLYIDGKAIGNEEKLISIFTDYRKCREKCNELETNFENRGDA